MPGPSLDSILKLKGSREDFKQENITDQVGLREGIPDSMLSIDGGKTGSLRPAFADGITMYMGGVWPQAAHPLSSGHSALGTQMGQIGARLPGMAPIGRPGSQVSMET